jgi:DNA-binding winged helix-turn-helix (wHTH) protein/tetratricopeptide (TPR) repeat protein
MSEKGLNTNAGDGFVEVGGVRLDLGSQRLDVDGKMVDLRPNSWELLKYMAARPGKLLSKDELVEAVWGDRVVTEASLNQAVRELRKALGDDARSPRYIETVHRRGFRFIAATEDHDSHRQSRPVSSCPTKLVGRKREVAYLHGLLGLATGGQPQFCFVTGEPGIGKTSLVQEFLNRLSATEGVAEPLIGQGQCIDQHGEGEAYLPILEALDQLARGQRGEWVQEQIKHYAPTWLVQMPWLLPSIEAAYDPQLLAATSTRMLREFCVLLEALATETSLVLWLEDLHWSDQATIDLLNALARRRGASRILILASFRPVDAAILDAPVRQLKQSLAQQNSASELALELLTAEAVGHYLTIHFDGIEQLPELTNLMYETTDGNPLFVITLADYLTDRQLLVRDRNVWSVTVPLETIREESPQSLKNIIELQQQLMTDRDLSLMETASVVGTGFSARAIANMLTEDLDEVETACDGLAQRGQFIVPTRSVEWPDNTVSQGYEFIHDVYRIALYDRLSPARLQRLHLQAGNALEKAFITQPEVVAAELALHFEIGRDPERAVVYLRLAAERARQRAAATEAAAYLERALAQVGALPRTDQSEQCELDLRLRLMRVLITASGYSAAELARNLQRALELCENLQENNSEIQILALQSAWSILGGDLPTAERIVIRAREVGQRLSDPILLSHEPLSSGLIALAKGQLKQAEVNFKRSVALLSDVDLREPTRLFGHDPVVASMGYSTISTWLLGNPDEARRRAKLVTARAESIGIPQVLANGLDMALTVAHLCGDVETAGAFAEALDDCMTKYGVEYAYSRPLAARSWLLLQSGDATAAMTGMEQDLEKARRAGHGLFYPIMYNTLAEACLVTGDILKGIEATDKAFERMRSGERALEAETWRLKGELLRLKKDPQGAEQCFRTAMTVATEQAALSLQLRVACSLGRLNWDTGLAEDAGHILSVILGRFTEGFDTADLVRASALSKQISSALE